MAGSIVVLHVDGDPDFVDSAARALEDASDRIEVHTETSATDGVEHLESADVDCVVSEYDVEPIDGLEFLDRVRAADPDVPFVFVTGTSSEAVVNEALSRGATDYVRKNGHAGFEVLAHRLAHYVDTARHREQRRRQRQALESARDGIGILDETGEFILVNEACCDLYGYDPEELVGKTWRYVHPEDEHGFFEETVIPTLLEEGEWHGETFGLRSDGTTFLENHSLTQTARGEFICAIRDLTETRQRERELERYETIVEAVGDGVYALDEDGRVIEVNETLLEMTGADYEDIVGASAAAFYADEDVERFDRAIRDLLAGEQSVATVTAPLQCADGSELAIEVTLTLLPPEDGAFRGTVGVIRDVTERKERKRELERYETLLELMPDTVVVTDLDGIVTEIHGFQSWSGYDSAEIVGEHMSKTMPEEDVERVEAIVADLVRSDDRSKATYEHHTVTKSGERIPFENHITLLPPDENGHIPGTMSVLRNISDRKERERELQRQNERLEEFAGIVSHDLRNPLNVASTRLELARAECDSEHLDSVARSHDRMAHLIEDLLRLARDSEPIEEVTDTDLAALADEAWQYVDGTSATLQVEADVTVRARPGRLRQLLENLLGNAVEHGGGDVTVRIGELEDGQGFYVADDGPGIPTDERDVVFESGYTTAEDGTGFGLSIVEEVATDHGWRVDVTESDPGGARFEIRGVDQ